ncbi:MAG: hypothetical protein ACUVQ5_04650 [Candidatus Methanomethylicaceae archaeon]
MRGNIPLIDVMGAFTIILIIYSAVGAHSLGYKGLMEECVKKEEIRALFYEELFSGNLSSSDFLGEKMLPNGIIITEGAPQDGCFLRFFLSGGEGAKVFFICKRG